MNLKESLLAFAIVTGISWGGADAQWVPSNGPYGGSVYSILSVPKASGDTLVYAGTDNGVFVSHDFGTAWKNAGTWTPGSFVYALAFITKGPDSSYLAAGTLGDGIRISNDYGNTWTYSNSGLNNKYVTSLLFTKNDSGRTLLMAATDNGVFRSEDYGATWEAVVHGLYQGIVINKLVEVPPDSGFPKMIFAGSYGRGIFRTSDFGNTWMPIDSGLAEWLQYDLVVAPDSSGHSNVFATTTQSGIYRTTDLGASWYSANYGLWTSAGAPYFYPINKINVSYEKNGFADLFAGTGGGGIYFSSDLGNHWKTVNNGVTDNYIFSMATIRGKGNDAEIMAGTDGQGILRSDNNGASWRLSNAGLNSTDVTALKAVRLPSGATDLFAATDGAGIFKSTDNGRSWVQADSGLDRKFILSMGAVTDSSGYTILLASTDKFHLFASTDLGNSWTEINSNVAGRSYAYVDSTLYVGGAGYYDFIYTSDFGKSWNDNLEIPDGYTVNSIVGLPNDSSGSDLLIATVGGVLRSTDAGKSFEPYGLPGVGVNALIISPYDSSIYAGTDSGVYISTDRGADWTAIDSGLTSLQSVVSFVIAHSAIFADVDSGGVFMSTNAGRSWKPVNEGLTNGRVQSIAVIQAGHANSAIFAGTYLQGVWERPLNEIMTGVGSAGGRVPAGFALRQNYPNPSNPTTVIEYDLPSAEHVSLKVYDILGREVTALVDSRQSPGAHRVRFDGGRLASGVYFYRLVAGSQRFVRKMLLLK